MTFEKNNTVVNTLSIKVLVTTVVLALGVSACSSEKEEASGGSHEVMAVDRVDEAAKLAIENGPEAEDMKFPKTAPMPATDTAVDGTAATDGTVASDGTMPTEAGTVATDTTATSTTDTTSADMPAADSTATATTGTTANTTVTNDAATAN